MAKESTDCITSLVKNVHRKSFYDQIILGQFNLSVLVKFQKLSSNNTTYVWQPTCSSRHRLPLHTFPMSRNPLHPFSGDENTSNSATTPSNSMLATLTANTNLATLAQERSRQAILQRPMQMPQPSSLIQAAVQPQQGFPSLVQLQPTLLQHQILLHAAQQQQQQQRQQLSALLLQRQLPTAVASLSLPQTTTTLQGLQVSLPPFNPAQTAAAAPVVLQAPASNSLLVPTSTSSPMVQTNQGISSSTTTTERIVPRATTTTTTTDSSSSYYYPTMHTSPSGRVYIHQLQDQDVLCGRGGKSNHHPGNKRYRQVVSDMKRHYREQTSKTSKTDLSRRIVDYVCGYGGRFVRQEGEKYYVLSKHDARKKTSQALRENKELKWTEP